MLDCDSLKLISQSCDSARILADRLQASNHHTHEVGHRLIRLLGGPPQLAASIPSGQLIVAIAPESLPPSHNRMIDRNPHEDNAAREGAIGRLPGKPRCNMGM